MSDVILKLFQGYIPDWQVEKTMGGYKATKGELGIRFFDIGIDERDKDYHARMLFYRGGGEPIYTQRANISSDARLYFDLQHLKNYEEFLPTIAALRHALHREEESREEAFETFDGNQSLDLENWPMETEREVIAGFAVKQGYTHLFGDAGVGKSILAHNIGLHAASDQRYLGFQALLKPIRVLYLSLEMYWDEFRQRHNVLLEHFPEIARENFRFICPESFDITTPRDRSFLGNTVTKLGSQLVIVDSHSDWKGEVDTNDNGEVGSKIIFPVRDMMKQLDFSIILLDHVGWKGEHPAGAKVVWNKASIGIFMEGDDAGENLTKISFKKWRNTARRKPRPISLTYNRDTYLIGRTSESALVDLFYKIHLPAKGPEITAQIMSLQGTKDRQARTKITEMVKAGLMVKEGLNYFPKKSE